MYRAAHGDPERVPWAGLEPHPYVTDWLDAPVEAPRGQRAVVVGCGLGDDAVELARRGYEATAFDVAATAVDWSAERFPQAAVSWRVADLLALPDDLLGAFDLVVEVCTVPSLPGVVRDAAMRAVGALAAPGGVVVVVTLLAVDAEVARARSGPPWAQAPSELATYRAGGLERLALEHPDADESGTMQVRLTLRKPG